MGEGATAIQSNKLIGQVIKSYLQGNCFLICKWPNWSIFNISIRKLNYSWKLQKVQGNLFDQGGKKNKEEKRKKTDDKNLW